MNFLEQLFNLKPFEPGCPWYDWHVLMPPNVNYCEAHVCSYTVTPNNTWTNLAYILVGLYFWLKEKNNPKKISHFYGIAVMMVGVGSFVYHMSLNQVTQLLDFFGMYVFCILLLMINLTRSGNWPTKHPIRLFWILTFGITIFTPLQMMMNFPIQLNILILAIILVITEFRNKENSRKYFWMTLGFIVVGEVFSLLDLKRVICDEHNHWIQGHGIWHICGGLAMWSGYHLMKTHESKLT